MSTTIEKKPARITKAMHFEDVIAMLNGEKPQYITTEQAVEFLEKEKTALTNKNANHSKKPTATQLENEKHKDRIVEYLATVPDGATVTQMIKAIPEFNGFNPQKVTAMTSAMDVNNSSRKGDDTRIASVVRKGVKYFTINLD